MSKKKNPLVSIILPVYNGQQFLSQSLQSCLGQTYKNIEVIVVNDCSTDDTLNIVKSFAERDTRVKIINNDKNLKLPASLNVGHKAAKGDFVSWTSDDNIYQLNAIQELYNRLVQTNSDIVFSAYNMIDSYGVFKREVQPLKDVHLLLGNCIGASFLYKMDVFNKNNGYNENLHTVEDYDFWLRAFRHSKYSYSQKVLYKYRIHEGSLTAQISNENSNIKNDFEDNLLRSYQSFFSTNENYLAQYLHSISRVKEFKIVDFLTEYEKVINDLSVIINDSPNIIFNDIRESIDLRLRANLGNFESNQNRKALFQILKYRHQVLTKYDRKRSFKYILNSLRRSHKLK